MFHVRRSSAAVTSAIGEMTSSAAAAAARSHNGDGAATDDYFFTEQVALTNILQYWRIWVCTRGVQKACRLTQLSTRYTHHILSLFNIVTCNWNALGSAFLRANPSLLLYLACVPVLVSAVLRGILLYVSMLLSIMTWLNKGSLLLLLQCQCV